MFEHPLEERCHQFGKRVRVYCRKLKKDLANIEDIKQLVKASGSVGANYIEANENVGKGDLKFRIKVCRKEAKESKLWLKHVLVGNGHNLEEERALLIQEAFELESIFGAILKKLNSRK